MNTIIISILIMCGVLILNYYLKPYYMPWLWKKAFELTAQVAIKKLLLKQKREQELKDQEEKNNNN